MIAFSRILLIVSLWLLISTAFGQNIKPASQDISVRAANALTVLKNHCACHDGQDTGHFNFRDHQAMVDKGQAKPRDHENSRIYQYITKDPSDAKFMPYMKPDDRLSTYDIQALAEWIDVGAPDFTSPVAARHPLTDDAILRAMADDINNTPQENRINIRYFTLTHLYNADVSDEELARYRVGLSKLLNSLSQTANITPPSVVANTERTVLKIDLTKYGWTNETWRKLLAVYPYGETYDSGDFKTITDFTQCFPQEGNLPFLRADWFAANASIPPLYNDILGLPKNAVALENQLGVHAQNDIDTNNAPRAGFTGSAVSRNNRVVERHTPLNVLYYWRSYDFRTSADKEDIFNHPLDFEEAGGEIIFTLKNGLQAYMLVNSRQKKEQSLDEGPIDIVFKKGDVHDPVIRNGLA